MAPELVLARIADSRALEKAPGADSANRDVDVEHAVVTEGELLRCPTLGAGVAKPEHAGAGTTGTLLELEQ